MFDNDLQVEQKVLDVLGADVDLRRLPDGGYVVDLADGGVIKFGEDEEGDWWTATRYEKDDDHMIYEGQDLAELGRIVTAAAFVPSGTTVAAAAAELDVTEEALRTLVDQIADDSDLYNDETFEITDAGMEVIRTALAASQPHGDDLLADVEGFAAEYADAQQKADDAMQKRDAAVRAAVAYGHNRTKVAQMAGISRERLYQIL
jgi:hypothetical protein